MLEILPLLTDIIQDTHDKYNDFFGYYRQKCFIFQYIEASWHLFTPQKALLQHKLSNSKMIDISTGKGQTPDRRESI